MDEFTRLSIGALSDLEQMEAEIRDGNTGREEVARELLKQLIDASDGPKLRFWLKAVGMVASKAVEEARGTS